MCPVVSNDCLLQVILITGFMCGVQKNYRLFTCIFKKNTASSYWILTWINWQNVSWFLPPPLCITIHNFILIIWIPWGITAMVVVVAFSF